MAKSVHTVHETVFGALENPHVRGGRDKYLPMEDLQIYFGRIEENGIWQRRSNLELYHSYRESDIVKFIKEERIKWAGHVVRMNEDCTTKSLQCPTNRHMEKRQAKSERD
ncbi:hypothetical protein TNCV_619551 [Trichonephila clavipes]|uniref:Uncharacterized protein n=1 Tax=Trichonephila clavipes TaxID=2585209 RepID=A0A8X6RV16_TRICX|nr:hypothetical protein TNCV_3306911 [Trichonephila clavipes]GFX99304.1 hypothetical protein TNCV_619551 [Trichonephila clavipes]